MNHCKNRVLIWIYSAFFALPIVVTQLKHQTFRSEQDTIAMKALMVLPTLLLQKTSLTSKSKDNVEKRRLNQWKDGQIEKLLVEGKTIQERLFKDNVKNQSSDRKATLFARFMENGKVNKALKLLESSKKGGIPPLTDETF